jgi:hypothetical protein
MRGGWRGEVLLDTCFPDEADTRRIGSRNNIVVGREVDKKLKRLSVYGVAGPHVCM